jgi:ribosomal protein S18 acetylase RimI-like enzyme
MVKYQFWLFHGQTFKKGDCPLYKNFESKMHSDDFDTNLQVPYYIKVARIGNHCVGFITYYISERRTEEKNGDIKKLGRIHLLCVDEKYRRLGIAHYLMSNVIDYFKENKCDRVYLITRPENSRAKSLYYKLGFVVTSNNEEVDVFDRDPAIILVKDI